MEILLHQSISGIVDKIIDKTNEQGNSFKPKGLWYSLDIYWTMFGMNPEGGEASLNYDNKEKLQMCEDLLKNKMADEGSELYYQINVKYTSLDNINPNKVLKIDSTENFDQFFIKYGEVTKDSSMAFIKWKKVAQDFAGIEIIPYQKDRVYFGRKNETDQKIRKFYRKNGHNVTHKTFWFYSGWDLPSGCIWNPTCIINFQQVTLINIISELKSKLN